MNNESGQVLNALLLRTRAALLYDSMVRRHRLHFSAIEAKAFKIRRAVAREPINNNLTYLFPEVSFNISSFKLAAHFAGDETSF